MREVVSSQASGQAQAGSHLHWGAQAQAVCCAACRQPQAQLGPLQVLQLQGACVTSFMLKFLGLDRRRDAVDT